MNKSLPRVHRFANLQFQPRFEYGDQAAAIQVCGAEDMSEPKGTSLEYEAENALIVYAIHPANWAENEN